MSLEDEIKAGALLVKDEKSIVAEILKTASQLINPKEVLRFTTDEEYEYVLVQNRHIEKLLSLFKIYYEICHAPEPIPVSEVPSFVVPKDVKIFVKQLAGWGATIQQLNDFSYVVAEAQRWDEVQILDFLHKYRPFFSYIINKCITS